MKKILSLFMTLIMVIGIVTGTSMIAYAGGWADQAIDIEFDTVYNASPSL